MDQYSRLWYEDNAWFRLEQQWFSAAMFEAIATLNPEVKKAAEAASQNPNSDNRKKLSDALLECAKEYVKTVFGKYKSISGHIEDYFIAKAKCPDEWQKDIVAINGAGGKEPSTVRFDDELFLSQKEK